MAEYIEREQVRDELLSWAVCINHPEHLLKEDALCVVDTIPAADVTPVKHGQWVNMTKAIVDTVGSCTNCGEEAVWRSRNKPYPLCPNCGAKMDLEVTNGLDQH